VLDDTNGKKANPRVRVGSSTHRVRCFVFTQAVLDGPADDATP